MPRRTSLALLIALLLAVALGYAVWKSGTANSGTAEGVAPANPVNRAETTAIGALEDVRESRAPAASIAPDAPLRSALETAPATASATPEVADLEAKTPLELVVVDEQAQPIFDAAIRVFGMRSASDPGSWYEFRGEPAVARTDPRGRAKLDCWTWVDLDGRTVSVDVTVTHPEYVPFRDDSFALAPGEHTIVLKRGAVVSVRAWQGAPNRIVDDVEIQLEREAALGPSAWTRESDGRMVTTRIAPGLHLVRVAHRPKPSGAPLFSAIETFEVRASERVDLSIELHAALAWEGRLDATVPRPVVDGRVMLSLQETRTEGGRACLWDQFETNVRPDGTFTFRDLPPGRGYVFALARGHVSKRVRAATLAEAGITLNAGATHEDEESAWKDFADLVLQLQRVEVPAPTSPVTIEMIPTGSIEVSVTRPDGKPIAEANVDVSPNVQIPGVGSTLVPWRAWNARADALGVARFEDVPPDPSLWIGASAAGLQMNAADRKDTPSVAVRSDEVARITIALEPAGTAK